MKKIGIILTVLILATIACTSSGDKETPVSQESTSLPESAVVVQEETAEESTNEVEPTLVSNDITIQETMVVDQDSVKITVKKLDLSSWLGPEVKVMIENGRAENITVQIRDLSVNDLMLSGVFSADVAAGKIANDGIALLSTELKQSGIDVIQKIELRFIVLNSSTFDTLFITNPLLINTSADPNYMQTFNEDGQLVYEGNGLRIIVQSLDDKESFWGAELYVFIDNQSSNNVTIQVRDLSINGIMVDPIFSSDVLSGKKAYDEITFLQSDLEENGITKISKVEFAFTIFDSETWNTITDTNVIEVSFN